MDIDLSVVLAPLSWQSARLSDVAWLSEPVCQIVFDNQCVGACFLFESR